MKLLKLIPAAAIVLTAFTTFEAKAGYPSGWTKKTSCKYPNSNSWNSDYTIYKLQKTDTPASYGVYHDQKNKWIIENVSYNCATDWYQYECDTNTNRSKPSCSD
tara:strand:+ start:34 stop:345 length:312 start_codon:yes stop_codon:yes gene_type:complete